MVDSDASLRKDQVIRIENLDAPIYRIYPLWYFEYAVRLKQLVLPSPTLWEDPFEVVGDAIAVEWFEAGQRQQVVINQSLPPAYAQCWSATAESDTLLRAYSRVVKDSEFRRNLTPREEGVRVKSTSRKLMHALTQGLTPGQDALCFVGAVKYLSQADLLQEIANAVGHIGLNVFEIPSNRAKLLLLKRDAFSHEAEVRLITVRRQVPDRNEDLLKVRIDPNEVFEEITFDPRLERFEWKEREAVLRKSGFEGVVKESQLYHRVILEVGLDKPPR